MDLEQKDISVCNLVTELIKHILQKNRIESANSYVPPKSDVKIIKSLRSKAFEILLNKSNKLYDQGNVVNLKNDPFVEILKHAFVLKLSLRCISEAEKLETLINELSAQETSIETAVDPVLHLLIELKNFQIEKSPVLDIFHYDKINPLLPEKIVSEHGIPMFQTYPMESFVLPEKFETMLGIRWTCIKQEESANFISRLSFKDQFVSRPVYGIETFRCNNIIEIVPYASNYNENTSGHYDIPFLLHNKQFDAEQINKLYLPTHRFMSNITLPCEWMKCTDNKEENENDLLSLDDSNHNFTNRSEYIRDDANLIWKNLQFSNNYISKLRTWESLGSLESPKQMLFITDLPETVLHLAKIRQTSILSLLPKKEIDRIPLMREVPFKKFLSDIKLLLFGIDSDSFKYNYTIGFKLKENITVQHISSEALTIVCQEVICWGDNFKSLSHFVSLDSQTGKLRQDGLIFKAMCTNIKELLLYYRVALQRIFNQYEFHGLLSLFKSVRPLARLIMEVAKLCGCNEQTAGQCTLSGGSKILTHIYKEVTKVTDPKIALVFYSLLKSCCEVYFRLLQNWLFEGTCDDVYGEFMIQTRSQYLRKRGRKFWTESFAIDTESVPGFLSDLSESVLQCGKTLRLLRICSPKNPVCVTSVIDQPDVRVCLSASMLREQLLRCEEYKRKGEVALGPIVSLSSAIEDQKKVERETAELVIRAQQETLSRINKQREELLAKIMEEKRARFEELKSQAEESALFKEKEKECEMLADKLLLEKINREQEKMREEQRAEREHITNYYNRLAIDVERKCVLSAWRKARISHSEKRKEFLESVKRFERTLSEDIVTGILDEITTDTDEPSKNIPGSSNADVCISEVELLPNEDENSNFTENKTLDIATTDTCKSINSEKNLSCIELVCANIDILPSESHEDIDAITNEEIANTKGSFTAMDTRNVHLSQESLSLNYIYKRNNERSNLQDFLRDEATKTSNPTALDTRLDDILEETDELTKKIGTINRPKSLSIQRIDNMTVVQTNKLKVLLQEYGMTPNNNEINAVFADEQQTIHRTNINDNDRISLNINEQTNTEYTKENINNNIPLILDIKLPEETATVDGSADNGECLNKNNTSDNTEEPISNNLQQNIADTPMSCTTDNFTTLSIHTPLSQMQNGDDLFASNVGQETSSLSDTVKSITEETGFESPMSNFKLPNWFSLDPARSIASSSLTTADVDMINHISLKIYLEKSIIVPLQIQSRLINNAIIKYLVNEHNIFLHLHSLRSYFFLLNGEFAKSLTDSLYSRLYTISTSIELFNSATLTNLLEKALMNSFSNSYVNSELLSLSAVDNPCELYISDPNALDCLCLNYKISWPLNIILDDTMMLQYSKVFKFLIMTGRMSWVLQEDFNIMKVQRNIVISEQYHKLQLYRHSMTQFMNALHNYLTCSVLHPSWNEFEKDLRNSRTIDQIYLSHVNYIKKILSRCMLNTRGEKMRVCLINIFKIILKFHNRLRSQTWTVESTNQYGHPNFKSLEQMYQSFCEWRTYMAHVAHKLATSGYQPHLTHFLNALNINHMYNLTRKQ